MAPAAIPQPLERRVAAAPPLRNSWPQWIAAGVGSAALIAAGYLGALVQLGTSQPQAPTRGPAESLPQPKPEPSAMPAPLLFPATPATIRESARAGAPTRRIRTHRVDVKAAALATAELERELYGQAAPKLAIRSQPKPEAAAFGRIQPSRQDVQRALLAMRPQLELCAFGRHGIVDARVGIAGTGRVTRALIQGDFAGTLEGSCMARALREATVAPFSGPIVQVQFPFSL